MDAVVVTFVRDLPENGVGMLQCAEGGHTNPSIRMLLSLPYHNLLAFARKRIENMNNLQISFFVLNHNLVCGIL